MGRVVVASLLALLCLATACHGHSRLSRHLLMEDPSMVVVLAEAEQTQGPFAEQDDDYVWTTNDLTVAGKAGAPGMGQEDRWTVVQGVPLELVLTVYDMTTGLELSDLQVFLWHTDAAGVYSAVDDPQQPPEFQTAGQVWCRGVQVTNATGQVSFRTILPGWYQGRAIHFHVRLRFPGATPFAATSQLYIGDSDLELFQTREPYASNPQPLTLLEEDGLLARFDASLQDLLTLKLQGSVDTGFTSALQLGLLPGDYSQFQGDGMGGPSEADGMGTAGQNVVVEVAPADPTDLPTQLQTLSPTVAPTMVEIPNLAPTSTIPPPDPTDIPTTVPMTPFPTLVPMTPFPTLVPMTPFPTSLLGPGPEGTFPIGSVEDLAEHNSNNNSTNTTEADEMEVEKGVAGEEIQDESTKEEAKSAISYAQPPHSFYLVVLMAVITTVTVLVPSWSTL